MVISQQTRFEAQEEATVYTYEAGVDELKVAEDSSKYGEQNH